MNKLKLNLDKDILYRTNYFLAMNLITYRDFIGNYSPPLNSGVKAKYLRSCPHIVLEIFAVISKRKQLNTEEKSGVLSYYD